MKTNNTSAARITKIAVTTGIITACVLIVLYMMETSDQSKSNPPGSTTAGGAVVLGFFAIYFLPTVAGVIRRSKQLATIIIINLLLGWTIIGWIVAMCFACWNSKEVSTKQ